MRPVTVIILHPEAPAGSGPLGRALEAARRELAERQRGGFMAAGADEVRVVAGPPDGISFGERLVAQLRSRSHRDLGGLIVLGSGSIPLARPDDLSRLVAVAAGPAGQALANNRYSADVVAVGRAADILELPPLPADNALPRWLAEVAGVAVADMRSRWQLGVDIDSPLDLVLVRLADPGLGAGNGPDRLGDLASAVQQRLEQVARVLHDRRGELFVAGRISASTLRWLERGAACRVRALVEERGLRASSALAQSGIAAEARPSRSILGRLLEREGPGSLARAASELGDAAVIDSRVLLAHRLGADESAWPAAEDRFASDLLLPASIADPWLRELTQSALDGNVVLGGHTLLNGGLRLLAGGTSRRTGPGRAVPPA